jgi:hypothetical protein
MRKKETGDSREMQNAELGIKEIEDKRNAEFGIKNSGDRSEELEDRR